MLKLLEQLREYLNNDLLYEIIISLLVVFVFILLAKILSYVIKRVFLPIALKTRTTVDDELLIASEKSIFRLVIISGVYIALSVFNQSLDTISLTSKKSLIEEYPHLTKIIDYIDVGLFILLMLLILWISFKFVNILFKLYSEKSGAFENKNLSGSLFPLLSKVAKIVIAIIVLAIVLAKMKIDISAFVVSLGVGSLAIALAAQETISNMISGFILMIDRPFRIGDRIKIGTDLIGDITEIGIRSTKIIDFDNNIIVIPNNDIVKSRIVNLNYPNNETRVLVDVGVGYGSDLDIVKSLIFEVAEAHPLVDKEIKPEVYFMKFGESSLDLRLAVRTVDFKDGFQIGCDLREAIYKIFNQNKISIPFPQRDIHIIKDNL